MDRQRLMCRLAGGLICCVLCPAPPAQAEDALPPWAAPAGDASVADWAANNLSNKGQAPDAKQLLPPHGGAPDAFSTPQPKPAGDRYQAAPTPPGAGNPIRDGAAAPAAGGGGNPLRGGVAPIQLGATPAPAQPLDGKARIAFRDNAPGAAPPPRRIAVGAAPNPHAAVPAPAGPEPSDAQPRPIMIPSEAFAIPEPPVSPAETEHRGAMMVEPADAPRVAAVSTFNEPEAFESSFAAAQAMPVATEGVGRPGPADLEGPQHAALEVEKRAPGEASIGQPCVFAIRVRNTGSATAENVVLTDQTPAGARLLSTRPSADQQEGRLVWRLGSLAAGDERIVEFEVEPLREGPLGSVATATMDASASAATHCTRPQLAIRVTAGDRVMLGDEQIVSIELHNPGSGSATGVMLVEDVPPQLRHEAGPHLEFEVGTLAPGETRRVDLRMSAAQAGRVVNTVAAVADGGLRDEKSVEFEVVAPSLAVSIDGPSRRYLERPASYTIGIDNPGTAAAKDVRLVTHLPRGMEFVRANNLGEYDAATHSVYWSLAELPEGERGEVEVVAMPTTPGEHTLHVQSEAHDGLEAEHSHQVRVEGIAALAFEVRDLNDPIEVGDETVYEIRVLNEGTKAAAGVRVRVETPRGMRVVAAQGDSGHRLAANRAEFAPIARLEPGQKAAYQVRVAGAEPGDQRVAVVVESDDLSQPIRREESTRVYGDE